MFKHGIRVYIYPGFTHAKAAIFDGWASVGSANLDRLSLKINRELNITTSEPRAVQELLDELHKLPPIYREALVLRNINEMSYENIATLLGCKLGTIKSRIRRGLLRLRDGLRELDDGRDSTDASCPSGESIAGRPRREDSRK